jgi:hypothetical protein
VDRAQHLEPPRISDHSVTNKPRIVYSR